MVAKWVIWTTEWFRDFRSMPSYRSVRGNSYFVTGASLAGMCAVPVVECPETFVGCGYDRS